MVFSIHQGIISFGVLIILFGIFDLYDHGLVFLNPITYSIFQPHQAWIRHFSSLCWILSPIAILFPVNKWIKTLLITWAFLFPILVFDRNRLLLAFFASVMTLIFKALIFNKLNWKKKLYFILSSLTLAAVLFIYIGQRRVGKYVIHNQYNVSSAPIPLEKPCNIPKSLPVKQIFKNLPPEFQWLFLYTTTPMFNLAIQYKCEIQDSSILKAQLIPFWKRFNSVGAPYLVANGQNVGTELMPFYMAYGVVGIFVGILGAYFLLKLSLILFLKEINIFNFLILLRLSYCSFMMGFAPQLFTWTTLGFVILMKSLEQLLKILKFNQTF